MITINTKHDASCFARTSRLIGSESRSLPTAVTSTAPGAARLTMAACPELPACRRSSCCCACAASPTRAARIVTRASSASQRRPAAGGSRHAASKEAGVEVARDEEQRDVSA